MKVLLFLCACIAAATAHGVIGYSAVPLAYHNSIITPLTTITRPLGVPYTGVHGYPVAVGPYFSYNLIPNNVVFPGVPGVIHYIPLVPKGKDKPDKKKPGEKTDKDSKEETTEESKTDEESETKTEGTEELAH